MIRVLQRGMSASSLKRKMLIGGTVALMMAAGFGGAAYAAGGSSAPVANLHSHAGKALASGKHSRPRRLPGIAIRFIRLAEHSIHVTAVVHTKSGFVTFAVDRGVVSSLSGTSIALKEADGQVVTDAVSSVTHVRPVKLGGISGVHDGEHVVVVSENGVAKVVWVPGARPWRVRGVVTSVSSSSITVKNAKGKAHTERVSSATRVLPASVGGIAGVHDGEHVVILEIGGNAKLIRVLKQPVAGGAARPNAA